MKENTEKLEKPDLGKDPSTELPSKPNVLMIMVDEYRYPRYGSGFGMMEAIKNIVGFKDGDTSGFEHYFPGFMRLRENAVVLSNHTIASSACIPSRAALFTGQYGTRTKVMQTDGVFKAGTDENFSWLEGNGVPTMGDWMKESGYETYYFGKCHFADPPDHSLEDFGFDDWESSFPEPHGTLKNNLGFYRDFGFADLVTTFLRGKGLALDYDRKVAWSHEEPVPTGEDHVEIPPPKPWFAVASFTNPHDITTWPVLPGQVDPHFELGKPLLVPPQGARSKPPIAGTWKIPLNPDGFPQHNADLPPNFSENLRKNNKPDCQYEYSLKLGIALASKTGKKKVVENAPALTGIPFPLAENKEEWARTYLQYYTYLHYVVDKHISRVLDTLDETGLSDNTIIMFVPDHGEYGAAHGGMLQKWHTAYQETVQVPVVFCLPPNKKVLTQTQPRQIDELTSHIDLLPTLLGLVGVKPRQREKYAQNLDSDHDIYPFVGADLSKLISGEADSFTDPIDPSQKRQGVLFATDDMITEPINQNEPYGETLPEEIQDFELYKKMVRQYKHTRDWKRITGDLTLGPISQPCHLVCYREKDWKLVRYSSDLGTLVQTDGYQWELYHLPSDPNEMNNLLQYDSHSFVAANTDYPEELEAPGIVEKAEQLYKNMLLQIQFKLSVFTPLK